MCSALERAAGERDLEHARALMAELEDASAVTQVALETRLSARNAARA